MPTNALESQCFTCRKRQVKCESTKPKCKRCEKDGLDCRGYKKPFRIIVYSPTQKAKSRLSSDALDQSLSVVNKLKKEIIERPFSAQPDYLDLLESFEYYDGHVLPRTTPAHWPFERVRVDRDVPWHVLPTPIHHCLILSLRSMLTGADDQNPKLLCKDLQHYRGSSLSKLQGLLQNADGDPHGIALACMILMMGADISLSRFGSWIIHFNAAQKLIALRGGFGRALNYLPQSRALLVRFMISDVFTASTCNSVQLECQPSHPSEYTDLIGMDEDLVKQGCLCPFPILQAIAQINNFRTGIACSASHLETIFDMIENFDILPWAQSRGREGIFSSSDPEDGRAVSAESVCCIADAARCFQLGALLYLVHSCCAVGYSHRVLQIATYRNELADLLRRFSNLAALDHDAALRRQLWKFVNWPLFISAYICIGWSTLSSIDQDQVQTKIDDIYAFGNKFHSSALVATASYLQSVLHIRLQRGLWTWDEGFTSRHSFVL